MSLVSAPYWWYECDRCGASAQDGSDYSAWKDKGTADIEPEERGWWVDGEHALCDECDPGDRESFEARDDVVAVSP
jgi:hypothetical protein